MGGPISRTAHPPPAGAVLGGKYELRRYLGSGAIGAVYDAVADDGRRVAVKLLTSLAHSEQPEEVATRFAREARVASQLDHPNVASVIDAGVDPSLRIAYLVMPLLCGVDLDELLQTEGCLHPTVACRIVCQACLGLAAAHQRDVIHRDVKPGNLFLAHARDGSVTVKLLDFGMAKLLGSEQSITGEGSLLGTPHYMAPEQSKSAKDADARADVWSLGASLYHALSGATPYQELRRFSDLLIALNTEPITPLQERAPWIDPGLATLVHGALLKDRQRRCPSAEALRDALLAFAGGSDELDSGMLLGFGGSDATAEPCELVSDWKPTSPSVAPAAPPVAPADPRIGARVDGYVVERRLTPRDRRAVYEASDGHGDRVALERIDDAGADLASLIALSHDNLVAIRERVSHQGDDYLVTELCAGTSLERLLARHGAIEPHYAVAIAIQACRGLEALHGAGVVHGCVSPAAMALCEDVDGTVRVVLNGPTALDLAVAARSDDALRHLAPEIVAPPHQATPKSDVFGLGATLYHALSGEPPWPAGAALREHIATGSPAHLQERAPWVRREITALVHGAIEPVVELRSADVHDLRQALEEHTMVNHFRLRDIGPVSAELRVRIEDKADAVTAPPPPPSLPVVSPPPRRPRWWPWLVLLAIVAAALAYLL